MREDVFSAPAQPAWPIARIIERLYGDLPDAQRVDRSLRNRLDELVGEPLH